MDMRNAKNIKQYLLLFLVMKFFSSLTFDYIYLLLVSSYCQKCVHRLLETLIGITENIRGFLYKSIFKIRKRKNL